MFEDSVVTDNIRNKYKYPFVFTNMPDIGGIPGRIINFTPFFPLELYNGFNNNSTDYDNIKKCVSTFEFFDKITIGKKIL